MDDAARTKLYGAVPLDFNQQQIRVLDLEPGKYGRKLSGTLRLISLISEPRCGTLDYEALSYTWGTSDKCCRIDLNRSHSLPITRNLDNALRRLRYCQCIRILWVDAICINQCDNVEKKAQVALMGHIFGTAVCVNVWLGEPQMSYLDRGLAALERFTGLPQTEASKVRSGAIVVSHPFTTSKEITESAIHSALNSSETCWRTRVWVVQEFVVARRIFLCCGDSRLEYDRSAQQWAGGALDQYLIYQPTGERAVEFFWRLCTDLDPLRRRYWKHGHISMSKALVSIHDQNASDPKDMVFGILGLLDEHDASLIQADYNESCEQTFARTTHAIIKSRSSLEILLFVDCARSPRSELPSWSLDFNSDARRSVWQMLARYDKYGSRDRTAIGMSTAELDRYGKRLTLSAIEVDSIRETVAIAKCPSWNAIHALASSILSAAAETWSLAASKHVSTTIYQFLQPQDYDESLRSRHHDTNDSFPWQVYLIGNILGAWESHTSGIKEETEQYGLRQRRVWNYYDDFIPAEIPGEWDSFRIFVTTKGRIGFGPFSLEVGDELLETDRKMDSLVLRRQRPVTSWQPKGLGSDDVNDDTCYTLVGPAYVHVAAFEQSELAPAQDETERKPARRFTII